MQYADDYFHPSNQRDEVIDVRGKDKGKYSTKRISIPLTPKKNVLDDYENKNLCIFQLPMENGRKKYQHIIYSGQTVVVTFGDFLAQIGSTNSLRVVKV